MRLVYDATRGVNGKKSVSNLSRAVRTLVSSRCHQNVETQGSRVSQTVRDTGLVADVMSVWSSHYDCAGIIYLYVVFEADIINLCS